MWFRLAHVGMMIEKGHYTEALQQLTLAESQYIANSRHCKVKQRTCADTSIQRIY